MYSQSRLRDPLSAASVGLLVCLLAFAAGCQGIEFADEGSGGGGSLEYRADEHEPNGGGNQMTAMAAGRAYLHTLWPDGDVDFSTLDTTGSPGVYTIEYGVEAGQPVALQAWVRPSPTRGPSRLVYERTLFHLQGHREIVRTTAEDPCIAIRVETALNGYAMYSIIVRKGDHREK